ncbi:MAG: hypothetical protein Q9227_001738, partial [Pyrenula ochraceoflavens]
MQELPDSPDMRYAQQNGSAKSARERIPNGDLRPPLPDTATHQPGVTQLVFCVGGIYAS